MNLKYIMEFPRKFFLAVPSIKPWAAGCEASMLSTLQCYTLKIVWSAFIQILPTFDLSDVTLELQRRLQMLQVDLASFVGIQDLLLEMNDLGDLGLDEVGVEVLLLDQLLGVDLQSSGILNKFN